MDNKQINNKKAKQKDNKLNICKLFKIKNKITYTKVNKPHSNTSQENKQKKYKKSASENYICIVIFKFTNLKEKQKIYY